MLCTDQIVVALLKELRNCVAEQLALCDRLPCRFPITWGNGPPPMDACDCACSRGDGQAWVRWVDTSPANFGGSGGDCAGLGGTYEFVLEVGVYRCWPVPGDAKPLDEQEEEQAAIGLLADAAAIRRALACCFEEDGQWQLLREDPIARQGGCTGVSAQLRVTAPDCECGSFSSTQPSTLQRGLSSRGGRAA